MNFVRKLTVTHHDKAKMFMSLLYGAKALLSQSIEHKVQFDQRLGLFQILNKAREEIAMTILGFSSAAFNMITTIPGKTSTCINHVELMC